MFQPSKEVMEVLDRYDATYRRHRQNNRCFVQIIDKSTQKNYTVADKDGVAIPLEIEGDDYQDALARACEIIPTATKPMTKAQAISMAQAVSEKDAEIARLKAELEAAKTTRTRSPRVQPAEPQTV